MFFKREEKKSGHLGLKLAVCALAVVGAVSIANCCKEKLSCAMNKMSSMFQKKPTPTCPTDNLDF